jgi:predicted ArsR family transcriptional regulator
VWRCTLPASTPLFDAPQYPEGAGFKVEGTSREAAETVDAATVRTQVVQWLQRYGQMSADKCAWLMDMSVLSIRPRFSELKALGVIEDSGSRAKNASGKSAVIWRLKP